MKIFGDLQTSAMVDRTLIRDLQKTARLYKNLQASAMADRVVVRDLQKTIRIYRDLQASAMLDRTVMNDLQKTARIYRDLQNKSSPIVSSLKDLEETLKLYRQLERTASTFVRNYDSRLAELADSEDVDPEFNDEFQESTTQEVSEFEDYATSSSPLPRSGESVATAEAIVARTEASPWLLQIIDRADNLLTLFDLACTEASTDEDVQTALEQNIQEFRDTVIRTAVWMLSKGHSEP